jgi:hypothetical protein
MNEFYANSYILCLLFVRGDIMQTSSVCAHFTTREVAITMTASFVRGGINCLRPDAALFMRLLTPEGGR